MERGITIKEIAEQAGVSIGTVSRIINNQPFGYSQETYERVQEVIRRSGYVPNRIARAMVTKKSYTIAYLVDDICNPFFPEIAKGISRYAAKEGFNMILCDGGQDQDQIREQFKRLYESGIDGIIAGAYVLSEKNVDFLLKSRLPFVVLDANMTEPCFSNISVDNYAGARMMTEYLISCGHKKIACITGSSEFASSRRRLSGYKAAMAEYGLDWNDLIIEGDYTVEGGRNAAAVLSTTDCTAIFAFNDLTAIGACNYLQENGIRIPEDISVAGFDDIAMASLMYPPLTTIRQPLFEMGEGAAELLIQSVKDGGVGKVRSEKYELSLVKRKSVLEIQ
ncbi:MAG: LacI family DNA-binding transcriptional regulator [Clostridiales bacterium]|nr:LacI family DNA-binding transcriptional regulator [Clostridiales bacterium]